MKTYQEFISENFLEYNIEGFSKSEIDELKQFVEDFEIDEDFTIIWKILNKTFILSKEYDEFTLKCIEKFYDRPVNDYIENYKSKSDETITEFLKRVYK